MKKTPHTFATQTMPAAPAKCPVCGLSTKRCRAINPNGHPAKES